MDGTYIYLEFRTFAELGVADDDLFQSLVRHFFQRRRVFLDLAEPPQNAANASMIYKCQLAHFHIIDHLPQNLLPGQEGDVLEGGKRDENCY